VRRPPFSAMLKLMSPRNYAKIDLAEVSERTRSKLGSKNK
jgi:hypothetical protein